nr:MAG TPA: hypothetical protein [Caudoviricetes sp.]
MSETIFKQPETFAKQPQKKLKHITFQLFEIFLII